MKLSDKGVALIKRHEGVVKEVYLDPVGYATAGVGHLLKAGTKSTNNELTLFKVGDKVSDAQIDAWLREDVEEAEDCVNANVAVGLTQEAFDALVSFVFNVGCSAFKKSTLLRLLNQNDIEGASDEFRKWVNARGMKLPGLVKRRAEERDLFLSTMKEVV